MNTLESSSGYDIATERADWFCLRSHPKHEHIAAAHLAKLEGLKVFNPRLRRRTATRRGLVWVTESLFPGYLFACFEFEAMLERVRYTTAVSSVVNFGNRYPVIAAEVIEELRREYGDHEIRVLSDDLVPGTEVTLTNKAFYGLKAVILRALPAKERVQVLLEMLGRTTQVEVSMQAVVVERSNGWRLKPSLASAV